MSRIGSLFAGIGGFELGFSRAGISTAWQVEIDPFCQKVLRERYPKIAPSLLSDIRQVGKDNLEQVEIITGGFPCQDLSIAGSPSKEREGLSGSRSGLFYEAVRVVRELKPRCIVLENVVGLQSANKGEDFKQVIHTLTKIGYGVQWRILDSQFFGVPQRRRRVYIIGCLGQECPRQVLFDSPSGERASKESQTSREDATARVGCSPERRVASTLIHPGKQYLSVMCTDNLIVDNRGVRRLTPTECERLQGFPEGWTDEGSDGVRYKSLGNAVTVPVVEWVAKRLKKVLDLI